MRARINSDHTRNPGRKSSSPRSQWAVSHAEAERVRGLTDLSALPNPKSRTISVRSKRSFVTLATKSPAIIDNLDSNSFTISTLGKSYGMKKSYSKKPALLHFAARSHSCLPRNISQPRGRVMLWSSNDDWKFDFIADTYYQLTRLLNHYQYQATKHTTKTILFVSILTVDSRAHLFFVATQFYIEFNDFMLYCNPLHVQHATAWILI